MSDGPQVAFKPQDKIVLTIGINTIVGTGKGFMAYEIVKRLKKLNDIDLLKKVEATISAKEKERNNKHQVFELSFDSKDIYTEKLIRQNYPHSSARIYDLGEKSKCISYHYAEVMLPGNILEPLYKV